MPGTHAEIVRTAHSIVVGAFAWDMANVEAFWSDGSGISDCEFREMLALAEYELRLIRMRKPKAQRRALKLLRRFLNPEQLRQYRSGREFRVTAASGAVYRFYPATGSLWQVQKHGKHWFGVRRFCYHDMGDIDERMPGADVTLAQLLMISCDEEGFLREANMQERRPECWDGAYMRRMRAARVEGYRVAA